MSPTRGRSSAIDYYAGTGTDTLSAAPASENMDDLIPDIAIYGGSGKDSLTVNDKAHTSANETANQYTVSDSLGVGSIARTYNVQIGTTIHYHLGETITYTSLSGGVTLDTDNVGTPVNVEGTLASIPTTINVGSGNTTVTIAASGQSLAAFGSPLTLNGGTGTDNVVVDDQKDLVWLVVALPGVSGMDLPHAPRLPLRGTHLLSGLQRECDPQHATTTAPRSMSRGCPV